MISNNKLIEIYNLAQKDSIKHSDQISRFWKKVLNRKIFKFEKDLINFRKNHVLSRGLDDARSMNKLYLLERLELFDQEFLKKNLPTKNVGNSNFSENFLGFYFDYGIIHHLKWFEEISKIIFKETKVVCEIGGGFGSLARIILNNYETKYILLDLPGSNLLSSFFLKEHYPNKKFYLYNNYLKDPLLKNLDNYDIFILPPWCKLEKSIKIDCFINTRSMMEMNKSIIKKYFDLIHTHISSNGFFLNINKYEYDLNDPRFDRKAGTSLDYITKEALTLPAYRKSAEDRIYIHEYPYDNNWDVVISKPSFLQWHIHFLLTQRKFENFNNNIKDELNKIKNITFPKYRKGLLKKTLLYMIKWYFRKKIYNIVKKVLLLFFRNNLKKISKILYGMTD